MRVACALVPSLAVQVALAGDPALRGRPLVIGAKTVYDVSPEARACGIVPGMPLRQACALCPEAVFLPADENRYEQAFEQAASVLESFSAVVDTGGPDCAYFDASAAPMSHDEEALAGRVSAKIHAATGLTACLGIAGGRFFSRAAASAARPGAPVIVPPGKEGELIAPFSVDFLPCPAGARERLELLGIRTIGQLAPFPREALTSQFGSQGALVHELALGIDRTPLTPVKRPDIIAGTAEFDPPAVTCAGILQACQAVLDRLLGTVQARGKLCRHMRLRVGAGPGASLARDFPFKEATCSSAVALSRLRTWLEATSLPAPATEVEISLRLVPETGKKLALWSVRGKTEPELGRLAEELKSRFGYQPLKKVQVVDPGAILPERRWKLADVSG